jgi:hypothetical protein
MSSSKRSSITKYSKPIKNGKIGLLDYEVYDVRGDGSCFYRAIYQILRESPKGASELNLTEGGITEDAGVKHIRDYIGNILRMVWDQEAIESVDNLCTLVSEAGEEDREQLLEDLNEMYPFVTDNVCSAKGTRRYQKVAELIEDMDDMMYASSLEIDIVKRMLESIANLSVIVISYTGKRGEKVEDKWKQDIMGLLQNSTKRDVGILLNKNNIHYQYLVFKGPSDVNFHTIMDRQRLIQLLDDKMDILSKAMSSMKIAGGGVGGKKFHKSKHIRKLYSVASKATLEEKRKK